MNRNIYSILSALFLTIGCMFFLNSTSPLTGYTISENVSPISSTIFSAYFFIGAIWMGYLASKQKKGQAAMDFLMTYGWAILAISAVVGILAYFGIFAGNHSSNEILLSPPFLANGATYEGGVYTFEATNTAPVGITVTEVDIGNCNSVVNRLVRPSEMIVITASCPNLLRDSNIILNFILEGTTLIQSSVGTVGSSNSNLGQGIQGGEAECGNGGLCSTNDDCNVGETCTVNTCVEPTESCDDGNLIDGDGCNSVCVPDRIGCDAICMVLCGNGAVDDSGEQCDDNNINNGDGCSDICQIEPGYSCEGEPTECTLLPECGDGIDNDLDERIDIEDPQCNGSTEWTSESIEEDGGDVEPE